MHIHAVLLALVVLSLMVMMIWAMHKLYGSGI